IVRRAVGVVDSRAAADGIADQDDVGQTLPGDEGREQFAVARDAGRLRIGTGMTMTGPVDQGETVAPRQRRSHRIKVAAAMTDGVQADDVAPLASLTEGNRDAADVTQFVRRRDAEALAQRPLGPN